MSAAAIILAAGTSSRMGSPKALLQLHGETFLDRLLGVLEPVCDPVVVVTGPDHDAIVKGIRRPARFVNNPHAHLGMITSLQCGLRALPATTRRVLFTLVDHPNLQPATITALAASGAALAAPRYQGRRGHPLAFDAALIPEFLAVAAGSSAREVLARHIVTCLDVDDPGVVEDIDTPQQYRQLEGARG